MKLIWQFLKQARRILLYRILRIKTEGVRIIIQDADKIFLIKHPYDNYWVFPGGGIKKGESIFDSAVREAQEETGLDIKGNLKRLGTYKNNEKGKRDTISVIVCDEWDISPLPKRIIDKIEVQKSGWFDLEKLPKISSATSRRLLELKNSKYSDEIRTW